MTTPPSLWWPPALLAAVLLADALLSQRPPAFISSCLHSVGFPREWWWVLIWAKLLATAGLIVGLWVPGIALASATGVVAYFVAASYAHVRARALGPAFWVNCLGMLALSVAVLVAVAVG
ncbi:MAG: DoxX family protein [Bowdeniella nasicola]|nr:DoxX family protein [Bowdeniella nasicola]